MPRRRPRPSEPSGRRARQPGRTSEDALDIDAISSRILGPQWAQAEGWSVRQSRNAEKRYRCPHCEGWIQPGTVHIVAFPHGQPEDRRHYHTPCWERHSGTRRPDA